MSLLPSASSLSFVRSVLDNYNHMFQLLVGHLLCTFWQQSSIKSKLLSRLEYAHFSLYEKGDIWDHMKYLLYEREMAAEKCSVSRKRIGFTALWSGYSSFHLETLVKYWCYEREMMNITAQFQWLKLVCTILWYEQSSNVLVPNQYAFKYKLKLAILSLTLKCFGVNGHAKCTYDKLLRKKTSSQSNG